jgi:Bacterial Ig-like domain
MVRDFQWIRLYSASPMAILCLSGLLAACGLNNSDISDTTPPSVTKTTPDSGGVMTPGDSIAITFDETMSTISVVLGGDMAPESDGGSFSTSTKSASASGVHSEASNDTLTIKPHTTWTTGNDRSLIVSARDVSGNPLPTLTLSFNIVDGMVYVSTPANGGSDGNPGTIDSPKATLPAGIIEAGNLGYSPGAVAVSEGTYSVDSGAGSPTHVVLTEGISIYGGYSADFSQRNPGVNVTTIQDTSAATAMFNPPNRAIDGGSGISSATVVDGFTIQGGGGDYSSAIFNHNGAAPTIRNNTVDGGSGGTISSGVLNIASSPRIQNNTIDGGNSGTDSYGIYNANSSPGILNNTINGGAGIQSSVGVLNDSASSSTIQNNTIDGGSGTVSSYGIADTDSSPATIQNNIVFNSGSGTTVCINESDNGTDTIQNNDLFDCGDYLYVNAISSQAFTDINDLNTMQTQASGNISMSPSFADIDGPDNNITTMDDNNWHLTASSPTQVTQGGLDLSSDFTDDKDGATRTDPWSMGAYEQDN